MDYRKLALEERLAIAQAQDTSLEVLQQLAKDPAEAVRQAIALNPNADEALLRSLGRRFPEEVLQNPAFAALQQENPDSEFVRLSLARSVTASPELLERFAQSKDEEMLIAIGQNPQTPLSVLDRLVNKPPLFQDEDATEIDDYRRIFTAIAENISTPAYLLVQIAEQWNIAQNAVARNPNTPIELLEKFATWRNPTILIAIAQNPAIPTAIVGQLVIEQYESVRQAARSHPNPPSNLEALVGFIERQPGTSPKLLEQLASDKREHVRYLVAMNPNTPIAVLETLAQDESPKVAAQTKQNANASEKVITNYAKFLVAQEKIISRSNKLRTEQEAVDLIRHPKSTDEALDVLTSFGGGSISINHAIAQSQVASADLLFKLSQQIQDIQGWGDLVKNLKTPGKALTHLFQCLSSARHPNALGYLAILSAHPNVPQDLWPDILDNPRLLASAAHNPNLPMDIMQELSRAEDWRIVGGIAQNPNTPPEILQQMMVEDVRIRCLLAQNPNLPFTLLEALSHQDESIIRQAVAQNPAAPLDILTTLVNDDDEAVVLRISYHPNATAELLERVVDTALTPRDDIEANLAKLLETCLLKLATHAHTNQIILRRLASCDRARVHYQMLQRHDLNAEIIQLIMDKTIAEMLDRNTMMDFTRSLSEICKHPNTPDRILENFATNQPKALWNAFGEILFWSLRIDVAQNPNTPLSILEMLSQDPQAQVQKAAVDAMQNRH